MQVVALKQQVERVVVDRRVQLTEPTFISNVTVKRALRFLRTRVERLEKESGRTWTSEERLDKRVELGQKALDSINSTADVLQKELQYNPIKILGLALMPEQLGTALFFITIVLAIVLQDTVRTSAEF